MQRSKLIHFYLTGIILFVLSIGCDNSDNFRFPEVPLRATINVMTDAEFIPLSVAGNSMMLRTHPNGNNTIGYNNNGIVIYNTGDTREQFYAFDCTCPHDLPESVAISPQGNKATCPRCGSVYVFPSEGQPATGSVSKYFLKKYKTFYNINTGDLLITN